MILGMIPGGRKAPVSGREGKWDRYPYRPCFVNFFSCPDIRVNLFSAQVTDFT
jgi:hypothetical protein